jgi:hypothetical protein
MKSGVRRRRLDRKVKEFSVYKSAFIERLAKFHEGENIRLSPDMGTFRAFSDELEEEVVADIENLDCPFMSQNKNLES